MEPSPPSPRKMHPPAKTNSLPPVKVERVTIQDLKNHCESIGLLGVGVDSFSQLGERSYHDFVARAKEEIQGGFKDTVAAYLGGAKNGIQLQKRLQEATLNEEFNLQKVALLKELPQKLTVINGYLAQLTSEVPIIRKEVEGISGSLKDSGMFLPKLLLQKICLELPVRKFNSLQEFVDDTGLTQVRDRILEKPIPYISGTPSERGAVIKALRAARE